MKKAALAALLVAAGLASSQVALAQGQANSGWYAGISFGQSEASDACAGLTGIPGVSCDDKDTAWKIFGGYQLNQNFAAELGYTNLGEAAVSGFGVNASIETTAFELVGVGSFPISNQFSVYGKLGLYRADSEGRSNVGLSADDTNTDLTFGFGVRYSFTGNLGVRAEWQRYGDVGGNNIGESDVDVLSVGLVFKF